VIYLLAFLVVSCSNDSEQGPPNETSRSFSMGFTTWSFGPNLQDVEETYSFIANNSDVYVEHLDNSIPWDALINDLPLPTQFTNEIAGKANRKIQGADLVLSVGLLNTGRDDLAQDIDGSVPLYDQLNDVQIQLAYSKYIHYLVNQFSPDYLIIAIEVNELWLQNNSLWQGYTLLIEEVIASAKATFPGIKIATSISLHNLFEPNIETPTEYTDAVMAHVNKMDFIAISYYPFLKNQRSVQEFQQTFDFLHSNTSKPIAIVESGHIAEDLVVPNLGVSIAGNPIEQNQFLETLLNNAENNNYEMVNWWAHRDYDALWEVFPPEVKDIGQLWRDTGLLNENGTARPALRTWQSFFNDQ